MSSRLCTSIFLGAAAIREANAEKRAKKAAASAMSC